MFPVLIGKTVGASLLIQLFSLGLPLLTGLLISKVLPERNEPLLQVLGAGLAAVVICYFAASWLRSRLLLHLRMLLDRRMRSQFMRHLFSLPYPFFQTHTAGDLTDRVSSNNQIWSLLSLSTVASFLDGLLFISYQLILFLYDVQMGLAVMFLGFLQILVFLLTNRRYSELTSQGLEVQSRTQGFLVQMLNGAETLKATGSEQEALLQWEKLFAEEQQAALVRGRWEAWIDSFQGLLRIGAPLAILYLGGYQVMNGKLDLGMMLALNALEPLVSVRCPRSSRMPEACSRFKLFWPESRM
ncbi:hypothetical protein LJK87_06055 [Paenibacillus sp. P25]|nr:hypothetical protein LJK87_06055 [Paenibacillus sp. P25]